MKKSIQRFVGLNVFTAVLMGCVGLGFAAAGGNGGRGGGGAQNSFSGRAVVVDATVAGVRTVVSDTGLLPSAGGALEASLLNVNVPGLITGEVAHATTVGQGDRSPQKRPSPTQT